eukprot:COSAG02_NODE_414_length_22826_cov_9.001364_8_plen_441_part_00
MLSKALAICWALLLAGRPGVEAQAPAGCDSEDELLSNLKWLKRSCPHETFADGFTLVPQAITTVGCADIARRVAGECGWLLNSSPWFESRKETLDAAVASAAVLPNDAPATYAIADPSAKTIHTCGAMLVDGFKDFPSPTNGMSRVTIDVGPSRGNVRLTLDSSTTLDGKANDNFRVYADTEEQEEARAVFSSDLPLAGSIDVPGGVASLLLVSDGAARHTSLRATVECVCEDSRNFKDTEGDGCSAYAQGPGAKHSRCASLLEFSGEVARSACPLACGACEPGLCASSPCLNGGTCAEGADGATCKTSDLVDRTAAVTNECCDEPTEDCSSGQPATCNAGCAAVLVPYYQDCQEVLAKEPGGVLAAVWSAVQACTATPRYECSCVVGWGGNNCEVSLCIRYGGLARCTQCLSCLDCRLHCSTLHAMQPMPTRRLCIHHV